MHRLAIRLPQTAEVCECDPEGAMAVPGTKPGKDGDKKEAEEPQDLLSAHHQERHRDRGLCTLGQPSHDQPK